MIPRDIPSEPGCLCVARSNSGLIYTWDVYLWISGDAYRAIIISNHSEPVTVESAQRSFDQFPQVWTRMKAAKTEPSS